MEVKGSEWKENERRVFGHMITEAVEYSTGTVSYQSAVADSKALVLQYATPRHRCTAPMIRRI